MIRVIVVEDSETGMKLLQEILLSDPEILLIGSARDGRSGAELARRMRPDVVIMDMHLPIMDGLNATREIMENAPTPVVMISGDSSRAMANWSLEAFQYGAVEVVKKPVGPAHPNHAAISLEFRTLIKAMAGVKVVRHYPHPQPRPQPQRSGPSEFRAVTSVTSPRVRRSLVAIAGSTGGPAALRVILESLPEGFHAPILVVQHISSGFTMEFADWLGRVTKYPVRIAETGMIPSGRAVYLAPEDHHLALTLRGTLAAWQTPKVGGFRPSASVLFETSARAYGPGLVAAILTGMGDDGVAGLKVVRQSGGVVLAQDEESSVVFGMPGAAVAAGVVDGVFPLTEIGPKIAEYFGFLRN